MAANINREYVIDSSTVLTLLLPDEHSKEVTNKFALYTQGKINFISTYLLPFEVLNGLRSAIIRKRVDEKLAVKLASHFFGLKIPLIKTDFDKSLMLALENNLTVYDASYLQLAQSKNISLLTRDNHLQQRFSQ